jgi:formylmethanofuran dehydrogenase subunit C
VSVVTLTLRAPLAEHLDLDGILPSRTADLSETGIASLPVSLGGRPRALGDLFTIRGERFAHIRVEGDLRLASRVGAGMAGGRIDIAGNVGDDAGMAMSGGLLHVSGNAGDRFCAAAPGASKGMTGGEAIVFGSAGSEVGARCRRGLIVVGGDTGPQPARDIIAGTLVVFGRTGAEPGRRSKRGSIVAMGEITVPATYRFACTYEPGFTRLLLLYIRRTHGVAVSDELVASRFRRYCGDAGEPGKGEILSAVR